MSPINDEIDEAAMAEADAALQELAAEYPGYAIADVEQMETCFAVLAAAGGAEADRLAELYGVAHNIKGQGSAFGYELMTVFGEALCRLTRDQDRLDPVGLSNVAALLQACRTVLTERLVGDGGLHGARLSANLEPLLKAA
jgi:hypothetical protein